MASKDTPVTEGKTVKLTRDTYIPIGVAGGMFITMLMACLWLTDQMYGFRGDMTMLTHKVEELTDKLQGAMDDRWTYSDQVQWAKLLQAGNKDIKVPVPEPKWKKK